MRYRQGGGGGGDDGGGGCGWFRWAATGGRCQMTKVSLVSSGFMISSRRLYLRNSQS